MLLIAKLTICRGAHADTQILSDSAQITHALHLNALFDAVQALLSSQRLGVTALGRHLPGDTTPKHAIKRMDRLLSNPHLHQERPLFYWHVARLLIGGMKHPRILVDWSPIDDRGRYFVLRAATPFAGRSFPIYERVHHKDACPICQRHLLDVLALLIPEQAQPILVTDAGFRVPWFRDVKSPLFGLGFGMHQTRSARRIEILLLIAMLANLVMLACGLKVRHDGRIRQFQSNSIRSRSVLSLWRVGR